MITTKQELEKAIILANRPGSVLPETIEVSRGLVLNQQETGLPAFQLVSELREKGIAVVLVRDPIRLQLINRKSKNRKWFKVFLTYEHEATYVSAQFIHAGDAYEYATRVQDRADQASKILVKIEVEC